MESIEKEMENDLHEKPKQLFKTRNTLFEKLSPENQVKVTESFNEKAEEFSYRKNVLNEFKAEKSESDIALYLALNVFWAIYPKKQFDVSLFYKLFKYD